GRGTRPTRGTGRRVRSRLDRSSLLLIFVVAAPPLIRRLLRIAGRRVLPRLLAPERHPVEEAPHRSDRLHAAAARAVGPVDVLALAQEHAQREALAVLVGADLGLRRRGAEVDAEVAAAPRVPRVLPAQAAALALELLERRTRGDRERHVAGVQ